LNAYGVFTLLGLFQQPSPSFSFLATLKNSFDCRVKIMNSELIEQIKNIAALENLGKLAKA
jgi:hypothetical protein